MCMTQKKFLELEKKLMLNDVLNFDPLDEVMINELLESGRSSSQYVAICPRDWIGAKSRNINNMVKATSLNRHFSKNKSSKVLNPAMSKVTEFYRIKRNEKRSKAPIRGLKSGGKQGLSSHTMNAGLTPNHFKEASMANNASAGNEPDSRNTLDTLMRGSNTKSQSFRLMGKRNNKGNGQSTTTFMEKKLDEFYKKSFKLQKKVIRNHNRKQERVANSLKNISKLKTCGS